MAKPAPKKSSRSSGPPRELGSTLEFMQLVWGVSHGLDTASKRMQRRLGVTGPQRLSLRIIGRQPGISAGELALVLHLNPSTLTGILERLCRAGYVSRQADGGDGRRALLALTARGRRLDALKAGTVEAAVQRVLRQLSAAEISSTQRALRSLRAALDSDT